MVMCALCLVSQKLVAIFDNGEGMTYEGLKAFATYFLSQSDRGLEKEEMDPTPAYLDGLISKFGVGATQAVCILLQCKIILTIALS